MLAGLREVGTAGVRGAIQGSAGDRHAHENVPSGGARTRGAAGLALESGHDKIAIETIAIAIILPGVA
ncbi:hypothetical protein ACOTHJ_30620 [Achromobacter xylosoxidans]|uniref:hypothetical protein n=1 Tax=Alcaligenes xylosoxydans xylosoxydans TaxID=85698 RepID=UPI0011B6566B|nr:hypothetical protein [Achromobacter xylosoxidans]